MEYNKINMGAYNLHFINTDKFKTITVSVNFTRYVKKEEVTIRRLLFDILTYSTKKYNKKRLLEIAKEDLYAIKSSSETGISGNYINSSVDIMFLNEKYSDKNIVKNSLSFLFEILFNPNVIDKKFDKLSMDILKNEIRSDLISTKDNINHYSKIKTFEEMDSNNPISFEMLGYIEDLNKINEESLYNYYNDVINNDVIDIFIVGDIDKDSIKNIFLNDFPFDNVRKSINNVLYNYNSSNIEKVLKVNEPKLKQASLTIACKALNLSLYERRYIFSAYNFILGGFSGRLFNNVREKNSLAYSIHSTNFPLSSTMLIRAGIDKNYYNKTLNIIKKDMKSMAKRITDKELNIAKNTAITSLNSIFETPSSIISYYFGLEIYKYDTLEEKINNVNKITKEEIINFSNKIKIDTILLLYGDEYEEN